MKEKIKKIMSNWFRIAILIIAIIFLYFVGLYVTTQVKKYNYSLIKETSSCNSHRVQQEWQKCIDSYMKFYIGSPPEFRYPY